MVHPQRLVWRYSWPSKSQKWTWGNLFQRIPSSSANLRHRVQPTTRTWTHLVVSSQYLWRPSPCMPSSPVLASWKSCWLWTHFCTYQSGTGMFGSVCVCGCRTLFRGIGWMRFGSASQYSCFWRKICPNSGTHVWEPKWLFWGYPTLWLRLPIVLHLLCFQ